ncbi:MAG: metal-dependent hydrolase [Acidithiobacillus sp.]
MGRTGHRLTGIAAGCLAACVLQAAGFWPSMGDWSLAAIPAGYFGGTAPDWLEIAHAEYSVKYQKWMRKSVIPHRTITHWWPVWAALSALLVAWPFPETGALLAVRMAGTGFVAGAWMHLLMDIPNPTGIPMATPYAKSRFGFGWWKSGNALEPLAGVLMVAGAGALLFGVAHRSPQTPGIFPISISTLFQSIP